MRPQKPLRPLVWVGASKKDYERFSPDLQHDLGFRLYRAQAGLPVPDEKPLSKGVLSGLGIRELVAEAEDGTYRVVYAVKLKAAVYVLHAFMKKSTHGIATPRHEIELIRSRYALARSMDEDSAPEPRARHH